MSSDPITEFRDIAVSPHGMEQRATLARLAAPDTMRALIDRIVNDPDALHSISTRSYRHPNGFDRISLHREAGAGEIRLHVWWPGTANDESIHNHPWDFRSVIVLGNLRFQVFERSDCGDEYDEYISGPSQARKPGEYAFEHRRTVRLIHVFEGSFTPGSTYQQNGSVLHRVLASRDVSTPVVSLVTRGIPYRDYSEVMLPLSTPVPRMRSFELFSEVEVRDRLRKLRGYLGS